MRGLTLSLIFTLILLSSCITARKAAGPASNYSENITKLRPTFDPSSVIQQDSSKTEVVMPQDKVPEQDVTEELDDILAEIIKRNGDIKLIPGYTIQVYSGRSRENADMVKTEIYRKVPDARPKQYFDEPNFKVSVGQYLEKIEAQKSFSELKSHFPQAILIPTKIPNTLPSANK